HRGGSVDDSMPHPGTRRCCALPQPGHQFPKPGQFRRQSWSRRSLSRAQTLSRKRRALQPLPRPPYLTTTPSKRHYKRYKPIWALMRRKCRHVCTRSGYCRLVCRSARAHHVVVRR
ncbi:hypothetical protein, partial [Mycobacterium tuberculosis]|uniref:hypothetical protein n=1 Tax=Mycobacterium tuberculosis TaxID=1773 RepID=UPI00099F95DC